jgi:hypothetical protein
MTELLERMREEPTRPIRRPPGGLHQRVACGILEPATFIAGTGGRRQRRR